MIRHAALLVLLSGCFDYRSLSSGLVQAQTADLALQDAGPRAEDGGSPPVDAAQEPADLAELGADGSDLATAPDMTSSADMTPTSVDMDPPFDDCAGKINGTPCGTSYCYTDTTVGKIGEKVCIGGGCVSRSRYCYDSEGSYSVCCTGGALGAFCQPSSGATCS